MLSSPSFTVLLATACLFLHAPAIHAQQCSGNPTPTNSIQTSLAAGYAAQVVATGLTAPRSVEFDSNGNLLVLEQARGLSSHVLKDNGGVCVTFQSSKDLILNSNVSCASSRVSSAVELTCISSRMASPFQQTNRQSTFPTPTPCTATATMPPLVRSAPRAPPLSLAWKIATTPPAPSSTHAQFPASSSSPAVVAEIST